MSGFFRAIGGGFGFGLAMSTTLQTEMRPVLRKRLLANIFFVLWVVWGLWKSFSIQSVEPTQHLFSFMMESAGWRSYPWQFTHMTVTFALIALTVAMIPVRGRTAFDLGWEGDTVMVIVLAMVAYASVYDIAYYSSWFGNNCTRLHVGCLNFANQADYFATGAYLVYWLRSLYVLRPGERGMIGICGNDVKEVHGGRFLLIPTAPVPHSVAVLSQIAFDMIIGMWDLYVHPDGRERATQLHHR